MYKTIIRKDRLMIMETHKILIVDDDSDDIEFLTQAFKQCGVESVKGVFSGASAFEYLNSIEQSEDLPKLIISDFMLPGVTGADFLAELRKIDRYMEIPVVIWSTTGRFVDKDKLAAFKVLDIIDKPTGFKGYESLATQISGLANK